MKDYFKRLKDHPGIEFGIMLTIFGALAGASNKSCSVTTGLLMGGIGMGVIVWSCILLSNFKSK